MNLSTASIDLRCTNPHPHGKGRADRGYTCGARLACIEPYTVGVLEIHCRRCDSYVRFDLTGDSSLRTASTALTV